MNPEAKHCPNCGKAGVEGMKFCPSCGTKFIQESVIQSDIEPGVKASQEPREERQRHIDELEASIKEKAENTSGQGKSAIIPEEVRGWNWGAFLLTWLWGVCNRVWIALLVLIPIPPFILAWAIVLGVKANEWAWRKKKWDSIEDFKRTQRKWSIAGAVVSVVYVIILITAILFSI